MGYDFESDQNYNFENTISMTLNIGKTCFLPGETINGTITLRPKQGNTQQFLTQPLAHLYLSEYACYTYTVEQRDPRTNLPTFVSKVAEEDIPILDLPLDFSAFQNQNINNTLNIPFTIHIPYKIYPSCMISSNAYIKHYLCIDFPSIGAKKTLIIVIKNPPYFSKYNNLLQTPAMCYKEMKKHKLIFSQGSFTASIKLDKNAFSYDDIIPFTVDIDLTKMALKLKDIKISIKRKTNKNYSYNHSQIYNSETITVGKKHLNFDKNQGKLHIEDVIAIDIDKNPKNIYKKLDVDNRKVSEKYSGIYLYPTCFGGLLSVEYFIKMEIEMDTMWSTTEDFSIPIDFFEPFPINPNLQPMNQNNPPYGYPPQQENNNNQPPYPQQPPYPGNNDNQQPYPQQLPSEEENNLPTAEELMKPQENNDNNNSQPPSQDNSNNNGFQSYPSF